MRCPASTRGGVGTPHRRHTHVESARPRTAHMLTLIATAAEHGDRRRRRDQPDPRAVPRPHVLDDRRLLPGDVRPAHVRIRPDPGGARRATRRCERCDRARRARARRGRGACSPSTRSSSPTARTRGRRDRRPAPARRRRAHVARVKAEGETQRQEQLVADAAARSGRGRQGHGRPARRRRRDDRRRIREGPARLARCQASTSS